MTKQIKITIGLIAFLAIAVVVLYFLNSPDTAPDQHVFNITIGETVHTVDIETFNAIGIIDITSNYNTSNTGDETRNFGGVPFKAILDYLDIDASGYSSVVFTAHDSYSTAISIEEALDQEVCVIVSHEDGERIKDRENGGSGPFMMVLPMDQFSQRWCKYLGEVSFNE